MARVLSTPYHLITRREHMGSQSPDIMTRCWIHWYRRACLVYVIRLQRAYSSVAISLLPLLDQDIPQLPSHPVGPVSVFISYFTYIRTQASYTPNSNPQSST